MVITGILNLFFIDQKKTARAKSKNSQLLILISETINFSML